MLNITSSNIKKYIAFILSFFLLFLIIVYFQNKLVLIIDMESTLQTKLHPEVFFSDSTHRYSQSNSETPDTIKGNRYYFALPDIEKVKYLRLDPEKVQTEISINKMILINYNLFQKIVYELPTNSLKALHQINNYKEENAKITFKTTGNDPQLESTLDLKHIATTNIMPLKAFLISILVFMISFYFYRIYKVKPHNDLLITKMVLYTLFFALALYKVDYYKDNINFGYPPDEIAHYSYIDYLSTHNSLIPEFENMYINNNNKSEANYLKHPPLYYKIMSLSIDRDLTKSENINLIRSVNTLIFAVSFLLLLYLGFNFNVSILSHFVYLTFISSLPMFAYIGASISNDNLAIIGGLLFIIALKSILEHKSSNFTFFLLGASIFIAYFSKLTAAILIFFAITLFLVYYFKLKIRFQITKVQILILAIFLVPIIYYQFHIFIHYHSLFPSLKITHYDQYINSGFFIPEDSRHYLEPFDWLLRMKHYIIEGWFGIHSHHSLVKSSFIDYIGFLILHVIAIISLFLKCPKESKAHCIIAKIGLLSLISVMIVQFLFSYSNHLNTGYMGGLQPRYLLPFMFSFAILASVFVNRFQHIFLFNIFVLVICIHAIYSDFFYFLKYYT